jgi:hypothetical protein
VPDRPEIPAQYEPTRREAEAAARVAKSRSCAPILVCRKINNRTGFRFDHPNQYHALMAVMDAVGVFDRDVFEGLIEQIGHACSTDGKFDLGKMNFVLGVLKNVQPRDTVEVMLAAQMAAVHMASMTCAKRLAGSENLMQQDCAERAFNKLARTFTAQIDALKRYRTGGEQTIRVERVTVNEGGQAIVGSVSHGGVGAQKKTEPTS